MWNLRTWFSGELGNVMLIVGLNDVKDLFNLNNAMILCYNHTSQSTSGKYLLLALL